MTADRRPAPASPFLVRRATADDLEVVVALRLALLREYDGHPIYGRLRPDAERRARPLFATQLDSDNEAMFLAEERGADGAVVGMIRCVESPASPLLVPDRYCYVSSVYVKPEHRRRGVLRLLFERVQRWCGERGLTEMRLHNVGSRPATAAAWDALGFEVVEQVRVLRLTPADARPGSVLGEVGALTEPLAPASPPSPASPASPASA